MASALGGDHAVVIGTVVFVAGRIEGDVRQRKQFTLVLGKELCDEPLPAVMLSLVILGTAVKRFFFERVKVVKLGYGNEEVPPVVADLVLHAALLMAGCGVSESQCESKVLLEAVEAIGEAALSVFENLVHQCGGIVQLLSNGNTTDMYQLADWKLAFKSLEELISIRPLFVIHDSES